MDWILAACLAQQTSLQPSIIQQFISVPLIGWVALSLEYLDSTGLPFLLQLIQLGCPPLTVSGIPWFHDLSKRRVGTRRCLLHDPIWDPLGHAFNNSFQFPQADGLPWVLNILIQLGWHFSHICFNWVALRLQFLVSIGFPRTRFWICFGIHSLPIFVAWCLKRLESRTTISQSYSSILGCR